MYKFSDLAISEIIGLAVLVFLLFYLLLYSWRRYMRVSSDLYTYIVIDDKGFKKILTRSSFILNPFDRILRKAQAPDIQYTTIDDSGERVTRHLLDKKTGEVNLRVQIYSLAFVSETTDGHTFDVKADVTFNLDPDGLCHTIRLEDFGRMLRTRVESVFSEEISRRKDEEVLRDMEIIRVDVLNKLQAREKDRQVLGVAVTDVDFEISEQPEPQLAMPSLQAIQANQEGDGQITEHALPASSPAYNSFLQKAMILRIDKLRDTLCATGDAHGLDAFLRIMEMETRRNIAEALGGSGGLVILSAEELGLTGGAILEEPLRSHFSKASVSRSGPEVVHPKNSEEPEEATVGKTDGSDFKTSAGS